MTQRNRLRMAAVTALAATVMVAIIACAGPRRTDSSTRTAPCDHAGLTRTLTDIAKTFEGASSRAALGEKIASKRPELLSVQRAAEKTSPSAMAEEKIACAAAGAIAAAMLTEIPVGVAGQTTENANAAGGQVRTFASTLKDICTAQSDPRRCALGKLFAASAPAISALDVYDQGRAANPVDDAPWAALGAQANNWRESVDSAWPEFIAQIAAIPSAGDNPEINGFTRTRLTRLSCNLQSGYAEIEANVIARARALQDPSARQALLASMTTFRDAHEAAAARASDALGLATTRPAACAAGGNADDCERDLITALNRTCIGLWGVSR